MEKSVYGSGRLVLGPGETIFLYTDGVTEAMDATGNFFSDQRLERFLAQAQSSPPRQLIEDLVKEVKVFSAQAPQSDDITALALRYLG